MGGLGFGQDVYFVGYPYGQFADFGELNWNYPLPFIKKGIVSCVEQEPDGTKRVYLDAHNNPGFSGGPVVFKESNSNSFKIASVISGYRYVNEPIYQNDQPIPFTFRYNTGIILSFSIQHAVEIAKSNPIGPEIET